MKKTFLVLATSFLLVDGFCQAQNLMPEGKDFEIVMNNKPLVKINGKTLSVMDVKKKMDLFLYEHHAEVIDNPVLVYQFYSQHWRDTLQKMIDDELIKMEAQTFKLNISEGDVRQEMEKRFGPNVTKRLDELGLTMEDAKKIIHDEIVVNNMTWYRVWAKTLQQVGPELVRAQYEPFLAKLPLKDEWTYKMITIRGDNETGEASKKAYDILLTSDLDEIKKEKKGFTGFLPSNVNMNISELITVSGKELSLEIKDILKNLNKKTYSSPVLQKSRVDGSTVHRIFYLVDHQKDDAPPFEELSGKIHELLVQKYGDVQREEYFSRLRKRFLSEDLIVKNMFPPSYQPFTICGS
jgi:hypothetical protein